MPGTDEDLSAIEKRNRIRAEAGLPLLNIQSEAAHLAKVRDQALFEEYFQTQRFRFSHLWSDPNRGIWANMCIWNTVRKKLREEMGKARTRR